VSRKEKRLAALRANPKGWRYDELRTILEEFGFQTSTSGTSHRVFKHPSGIRVGLVDSGSGTLLPVYAKAALKAIDSLPAPTSPDEESPNEPG
jgi:predicted RNA binding protein YcfA (HicA-like mRNA interferase family)